MKHKGCFIMQKKDNYEETIQGDSVICKSF